MKFLSKLAELFKDEEPVAVEAPKPVELKKRTKKLVSKKETVDLGVTSVRLTFQDGRELITRVYGKVDSNGEQGEDSFINIDFYGKPKTIEVEEPRAFFNLYKSEQAAEDFISRVGKGKRSYEEFLPPDNTFVDCPRKPTVSFVGKVISAQIIKTEQCLEEVTKYSVEPI